MKMILALTTLMVFASCSKFQEKMKTKSKITPIAKAQQLKEIKGDGKYFTMRLKYPLTTEEVGMYNYKDIMYNGENLFLGSFGDMFKYGFANLFINLGSYSKIKYTTDLELPEIDPSVIKSIKIKKIFFALEPCERDEKNCETYRKKEKLTFRFLDKLFVNLSVIENHDSLSFREEPVSILTKKQFAPELNRARYYTAQTKEEKEKYSTPEDLKQFHNVTLAKYETNLSWFDNKIKKYKKVKDDGLYFVFKEKDHFVAIKNFFKKSYFNGIIQDVTIMGDSVVVELMKDATEENNQAMKARFFNALNKSGFNKSGLFAYNGNPKHPRKPEGCSFVNCVDLEVNDFNLSPMLGKSNHLKIDSFISINDVPGNDFKYKGFIELEVKMDVPL
jgi:hypothetical protein